MKRIFLFCFIILFISPVFCQLDSSVIKWKQDLDYMAAKMKQYHKNLFHTLSENKFDSMVTSLKNRLPLLTTDEILMGIAGIEAAIGDGHTQFNLTKNSGFTWHNFPVRFYQFSDGVYIRAADENNKDLVAAKVLQVGSVNITEALDRLNTIIASDNPFGKIYFQSVYLNISEVLHGLKLSASADSALFTLEKNGRQFKQWLKAGYVQETIKGDMDTYWFNPTGWTDASGTNNPLWLQSGRDEKYRMKYLPGQRLLYAQINEINDKGGNNETLVDFYNSLFAVADSVHPRKIAFDLRLNGGGNGYFNKALLLKILKSGYDQKGKIFVITGRRTFSAAQMLVTLLRSYTNAVLIGEPTGSKANHYGDSRKIILPNSKVTVRVSTLWHQLGSAADESEITGPDVYTPYSFADYTHGNDPALQAVIGYKPEPTLAEQLKEIISNGGDSASVIKAYKKFKSDPSKKYTDTRISLRDLGSTFYNVKNYRVATLLFALNAAEYNTIRENTLAGLGYEALGNKTIALKYYRKAFAMDMKNDDLATVIRRLEG